MCQGKNENLWERLQSRFKLTEKSNPHSRNLRTGRVSLPNHVYSLTTTTHKRALLFEDFYLARLLICEMRRLADAGFCQSKAFVVMPDHVHWLVQLSAASNLSHFMKLFKGRTATFINRYRGQRGAVWQDGFHDRALRKEDNLKTIARYIIMNPLRAGLVQSVNGYPHWDAVWI